MKLPLAAVLDAAHPDQITLALTITADDEAFQGHFPGEPILPGVVQLDWALQAAHMYLGCPQKTARDFRIKFHNIIRPTMPVILNLMWDRARGRFDFTYKSGETILSSGQMRFGAPS